MPTVRSVEKKIYDLEKFKVIIRFEGKNVRSDASLPTQYIGQRMTKSSATVSDFRRKFQRQYPGYHVDVLLSNGQAAFGQMQLKTVRSTYLEED